MKAKTINKILTAKFEKWKDSIKDKAVQDLVAKNTIITGGAIVSLLQQENVNDYDMYFRNKETALAVAQYYCDVYQKAHPDWHLKAVDAGDRVTISVNNSKNHSVAGNPEQEPSVEESMASFAEADEVPRTAIDKKAGGEDEESSDASKRYQPVFLSSNAITLTTKVQLIIRFYGEPDEIHKNFDYVHVLSYWDSGSGALHLNPKSLECILAKELVYQGSLYPICSIIRMRKFLARGWTINAGQIVKMAYQISYLNLEDVNVLKDQLVGVDSLYFAKFISDMKKYIKEGGTVDQNYVVSLLDKIF